jgi:hypothetical protein
VSNQRSSSTSRTTARAAVVNPVGRYGVAKNVRCRVSTACSACATAARWPSSEPDSWPVVHAISARSRSASARQASIAATRTELRAGEGHSSEIARTETAPARPQPAMRSGIEETGPGSDTGRMNASSSEVVAPASTELTTPANRIANPTTPIASAAATVEREASVPRQMRTAQATTSELWASTRSRSGPEKSTSSSIANEPNAANVARIGLPITLSPIANIAGMISAARAARRRAAYPGSCVRSQSQPGTVRL